MFFGASFLAGMSRPKVLARAQVVTFTITSAARKAALPVVAALGGAVIPALIYFAFNPEGAASRGWGVPMATDIAFAIGVLALFGRRVPIGLKVFLTALAIADDMLAVLVIAGFYTEQINVLALASAAFFLGLYPRRPLVAVLAAAACAYLAWSFKQSNVFLAGGVGLFLLARRDWVRLGILCAVMTTACGATNIWFRNRTRSRVPRSYDRATLTSLSSKPSCRTRRTRTCLVAISYARRYSPSMNSAAS